MTSFEKLIHPEMDKPLQIKKVFDIYNHATYVHLLKNNIVKKKYSHSSENIRYFWKEAYMMDYLSKCDNVVNLIYPDSKKLILYSKLENIKVSKYLIISHLIK